MPERGEYAFVVGVTARGVRAAEHAGVDAAGDELLHRRRHERLHDRRAGDRRGRADSRLDAVDRDRGVADGAVVVDQDVGELHQPSAGLGGGVATAHDGNDARTGGTAPFGELVGDRVAAAVRGDDERVAGGDVGVGEQLFSEPAGALQCRRADRALVQHQRRNEDRVDGGETSGAVEDLLGQEVRVACAEHVHEPTTGDRVGQAVGCQRRAR